MDQRKIIVILIIVCILLAGVVCYLAFLSNSTEKVVNNTTNITTNSTNETANATLVSSDSSNNEDYSSYSEPSSSNSEPEYGSDEYVQRWDESNLNGDNWAYTHDQPVKTDDDGHSYKRMYDEDTGENYWGRMD
ncbi:hypothetical protein [Methanobrevibacter sp.]|uniref:hypothetical protein n=1 Tax=Methanobrevibacter sp. TaxID=66852 RepID=UPI00388E25EA